MMCLHKRPRIIFVKGHSKEVTKSEALHPRKRGSFGTAANAEWDPMRSIMLQNVWNAITLGVGIAMSTPRRVDNILLSDQISKGKATNIFIVDCWLQCDRIASVKRVLLPVLQYTFSLMFSFSVYFKATIPTMHSFFQTFSFVLFWFLTNRHLDVILLVR